MFIEELFVFDLPVCSSGDIVITTKKAKSEDKFLYPTYPRWQRLDGGVSIVKS
jgi:hypothetical protein